MDQRSARTVLLGVALVGVLFLAPDVCGQAGPGGSTGKTRTYYIAADEVSWDYAPSGRDEAMGHPFDDLQKYYTTPGPHRIGRVYKKAIYREYTDGTFSTLKVRPPDEQYLGLLGPILRGEVGDTIKIINENESWYLEDNIRAHCTDPKGVNRAETRLLTPGGMVTPVVGTGFVDTNIKWSINGYIFGNMPMMTMKQGDRVRWYVATLGDFNNAHTPHWHGNTVLVAGQRTDVVAVNPAQMITADMVPDAPGIWLYHCHISDHMLAGMDARYEVKPR